MYNPAKPQTMILKKICAFFRPLREPLMKSDRAFLPIILLATLVSMSTIFLEASLGIVALTLVSSFALAAVVYCFIKKLGHGI